ncbi:unnamed protein product [Closterium sp. NIES-64]|nr:unnamed protein product [Closterium sp. NIES-64]
MPTANLTRDRPSDMQPQSTAADNVHPLERVTATTSDREIEHPSLAGENARDRATTISDSEAEADTTEEVFKEHFDVEDGSQISCGEEPGPDEDEERADMGHSSQSTNTATHPLSTTTAQQAAMRSQRQMEIIRGRRNAREAGARGRERAGTPVARLPTQGSQSARQPTPQQGVKTDMGQANDAAEATDVNHGRQTGLGGLGNADAERVDSDTMEEGAAIIVRTGQDGPRNKRRKKITIFIKQWARCYALICRFGIYSSQMVESINNAIKKIRILPVSYMPLQQNVFYCGIFVCQYIHALVEACFEGAENGVRFSMSPLAYRRGLRDDVCALAEGRLIGELTAAGHEIPCGNEIRKPPEVDVIGDEAWQMPLQQNVFYCGIFVCQYIHALVEACFEGAENGVRFSMSPLAYRRGLRDDVCALAEGRLIGELTAAGHEIPCGNEIRKPPEVDVIGDEVEDREWRAEMAERMHRHLTSNTHTHR